MKKMSIILIFILALASAVTVSAFDTVSEMRIGIYYGSNAREEYTVECPDGFNIGYFEGRDFVKAADCSLSSVKIVKGNEGGNYINVLNPLTGETVYTADTSGRGIAVLPVYENDEDNKVKIISKASGNYRGGFDFRRFSGGNITAVNVVPLDGYLYGVISREVSTSWNIEALKVASVCARNVALSQLDRHKDMGFDLCNTTCCQVYSGLDYEDEGSHRPVDETSGEVLLYGDELVIAVYSSSMGERTEDVKNVWGSNVPYLVSVSNEYEDTENVHNGVWENTLTKARATEIMKSRGYDIGDVTDIEALEYTEAKRVLKLKVTGTKGYKIFERESCRTIFAEVTLSQMYTISGGGKASYPTVYVLSGDGKTSVSAEGMHVLGKGKVTAFYATDGTTVSLYEGEKGGDSFVFSGIGWGHGVGLSQYGSKGMADAGFTYEEILTHYYTGTHLGRL